MDTPEPIIMQPPPYDPRQEAYNHIAQYYPLWRQLNVLREGNPVEIERMGTFIDAVRAWSDGTNPDPAALRAIVPE